MVKCLPSVYQVLGSIHSTTKTRETELFTRLGILGVVLYPLTSELVAAYLIHCLLASVFKGKNGVTF